MKKFSFYTLSVMMLAGIVWMLYVAVNFAFQYSLLFVPMIFVPAASLLHMKGTKHDGVALLLEALSLVAFAVFTIIMLLPF